MVYALVAIIIVLLAVWIWLNTMLIRKQDKPVTPSENEEGAIQESVGENRAVEGSKAESSLERETEMEPEPEPGPGRRHITEVELASPESKNGQGVFAQSARPFVLHDVNVPEFADMAFQTAFHHLSTDERVLGWVAFHEDRLGASDRSYDQAFLEALRAHRHATEKLRRHVGLSQVTETAVVGAEGKVWFLTAMEDAWFALFIDKDVDGMKLAQELLAPVQAATTIDPE